MCFSESPNFYSRGYGILCVSQKVQTLIAAATVYVTFSGHKPSYSSSPVVWIRQASLQSDILNVLRHARKMPKKLPISIKN